MSAKFARVFLTPLMLMSLAFAAHLEAADPASSKASRSTAEGGEGDSENRWRGR